MADSHAMDASRSEQGEEETAEDEARQGILIFDMGERECQHYAIKR